MYIFNTVKPSAGICGLTSAILILFSTQALSQQDEKIVICHKITKTDGSPAGQETLLISKEAANVHLLTVLHGDSEGACVGDTVACNDKTPNGAPCDDRNACTGNGTCQNGVCEEGISSTNCANTLECNPKTGKCDICNPDTDPLGCKRCNPKATTDECADLNPCNGEESCDESGVCIRSVTPLCTSRSECKTSTCVDFVGCVTTNDPDGSSCSSCGAEPGCECQDGDCKAR